MKLLYEEYLPFQYKMYKKTLDMPLSDKIKSEFNEFFHYIKEADYNDEDKLLRALSEQYQEIRCHVAEEIEAHGKSKFSHVLEELQFIFTCSYLLIDKCGLTQGRLADVWGMDKRNFSKLDIYPQRCRDAYNRNSSGAERKVLVPDKDNYVGVQIAEYINKNIQAVHACKTFIGVTNELDVFVNITSTDKKAYVLTCPLSPEDATRKARRK